MKKSFGIYSIIWAIYLALFNVVVFVTPNEIGGVSKFGGSFWVGYIFITVAFTVQLICAFVSFKAKRLKNLFYSIPLIYISYVGLTVMLAVGAVCMVIPALPEWIAIIVCFAVLAFNVIAIIKSSFAANTVIEVDKKTEADFSFIKKLTVDADSLVAFADGDALSSAAKRVYEAFRYGDPTSNESLSELDVRIEREFSAFADAVRSEDAELADAAARSLVEMVEERNRKCKLLK